jgi:hypothetical protein
VFLVEHVIVASPERTCRVTVDYDEWKSAEQRVTEESIVKCSKELARRREIRLTSLFPEFGLKAEDNYTMWRPPGSPELKQLDPTGNLGNLLVHYNKILVPINHYRSKQDFENFYAMSIEELTQCLKENPSNYVPLVGASGEIYKAAGFYDDLLQTCRGLYGHYPVHAPFRSSKFHELLSMITKSVLKGDTFREPSEALRARFPELDIRWILDKEVDQIVSRDPEELRSLSNAMRVQSDHAKDNLASLILSLRSCGYDDLVKFLLDGFHRGHTNLLTLHEILFQYRTFLVQPVSESVGGFENYTTQHLENMAFLRILPLRAKDLKNLDTANMRLLCNAPGARSAVNLQSYKMQVFLRGGDDVNTLNELAKFGERHKKELKRMSEYREFVARGHLRDAGEALRRSGEVYAQIGEEVEELTKKEKTAKLATWFMTGGATMLSDAALVLYQGLPSGWQLVMMLFKDLLGSRIKDIDPKRIVELIYDTRQWPWYEKGIPYLYWKASDSRSSRGALPRTAWIVFFNSPLI